MIIFRYKFFSVATLLALIFIATGNTKADQFQWSLTTGDQLEVTLNHSTKSDSKVGDFSASQTYRYQLQTTWNVTEVDSDQTATIEKTIRSIRFAINCVSPVAFNLSADTQTGTSVGKTLSGTEGSVYLRHLQSLIGKKLRLRIKPTGKTEMLPIPAETKAAIDAFPGTDYVLQAFAITSIVESETSYFIVLPSKSIVPGETWGRESDAGVHENEAFITQFKYLGATQESEPSLVEFSISMQPKKSGDRVMPPGGAEAATVSKQTGTGQCFFDQNEKHFTAATYRSTIISSGSGQRTIITSDYSTKIIRK